MEGEIDEPATFCIQWAQNFDMHDISIVFIETIAVS